MHANVHLVPVKDDIIQRVQRGRGFGGFLRMWRVVCGALQRSAKVPEVRSGSLWGLYPPGWLQTEAHLWRRRHHMWIEPFTRKSVGLLN